MAHFDITGGTDLSTLYSEPMVLFISELVTEWEIKGVMGDITHNWCKGVGMKAPYLINVYPTAIFFSGEKFTIKICVVINGIKEYGTYEAIFTNTQKIPLYGV